MLKHEELTEKLIGIFYSVYNELGYGLLEGVYEEAFAITLREQGIAFEQQAAIPVSFHGQLLGEFRADFLIGKEVVLELKAARAIEMSHEAQLLNYLKATSIEVGLLLNFGPRAQFRRLVFENSRKRLAAGAS